MLSRLTGPVKRVAIVRAARIGDFLCAMPAVRALAAALPGAQFTWIGLPFVADLVARSPYLDRFVAFPGFPGMADQFFEPAKALRFLSAMQAEEFDLALQMHGSGVYSNPFTLLMGARYTAGFVRPGEPPGRLDAALPMPASGHEIDRLLALAEFLGAPAAGRASEYPLFDEDRVAAATLLAGAAAPLIGVHPAAREATKRWPPPRFAEAALALRAADGGTIVIVGGPDERELAAQVAAECEGRAPGSTLNLAGRTSLGSLGAVIARLAILISNDSGPAHIAYALATPSVTIFGGTDPAHWGPPAGGPGRVIVNRVPCWPCDYWECPIGYRCLAGIEPATVVAAAEEVMHRNDTQPALARR